MSEQVGVNPKHGRAGRHPTKESLDALSGHGDPGMFGRMFPTLSPLVVADQKLKALADAMLDAGTGGSGDNAQVPAGFTYLGLFIDHDITLDLTDGAGGPGESTFRSVTEVTFRGP